MPAADSARRKDRYRVLPRLVGDDHGLGLRLTRATLLPVSQQAASDRDVVSALAEVDRNERARPGKALPVRGHGCGSNGATFASASDKFLAMFHHRFHTASCGTSSEVTVMFGLGVVASRSARAFQNRLGSATRKSGGRFCRFTRRNRDPPRPEPTIRRATRTSARVSD